MGHATVQPRCRDYSSKTVHCVASMSFYFTVMSLTFLRDPKQIRNGVPLLAFAQVLV